jgi:transposase-like protein
VTDGLKGMSEAQTCIVHLLRHSLDYASWKERKALAALRPIYTAPLRRPPAAPSTPLKAAAWGAGFPQWWRPGGAPGHMSSHSSRSRRRRVIYTTNALESVHARLRKIIKTRGHLPNDEAATKLLWLALRNLTRRWTMPIRPWREAMSQFAVLYQSVSFFARRKMPRMDAAVPIDAKNG